MGCGYCNDACRGLANEIYLVLAREDVTNQVEGRALRQKTTSIFCKSLLEDVGYRYGCIEKMVADRGELNSNKVEQIFDRVNHFSMSFVELGHAYTLLMAIRRR